MFKFFGSMNLNPTSECGGPSSLVEELQRLGQIRER
jgi:hypothetical protein